MGNVIELQKPIYQTIKQTAEYTGLSQYFLRQLLKAGKLPHMKTGVKILVNVPLLLTKLDKESDKD